jgi:hypothetical protein
MTDNEVLCQEEIFGKHTEMPSNLDAENRSSPGFGLCSPSFRLRSVSFDPTNRPDQVVSLCSWLLKIGLCRAVSTGKIACPVEASSAKADRRRWMPTTCHMPGIHRLAESLLSGAACYNLAAGSKPLDRSYLKIIFLVRA